MPGFVQDVRFALRRLGKSAGFTTAAVLTLMVGIGATTAIFSVLDAVVLRPLPFAESDRLYMVWETMPGNDTRWVAPGNYLDWRRETTSFSGLAAFGNAAATITGGDGAERIEIASVSTNFFDVLRMDAPIGRPFLPSDGIAGAERVVVLGHGLWRRRYGADRGIIDRTIALDGQAHRVVGVMPESFRFPEGAELWVAGRRDVPDLVGVTGDFTTSRDVRYFAVVGRLADDVDIDRARAEMRAITTRLAALHPVDNEGLGVNIVSMQRWLVGDVDSTLLLLFGAVALVLVIACANVASLLLARGEERARESAIRVALGATRGRILSQTFAESLVIGVLGGGAGILLGAWGIGAILALAPGDVPRVAEIGLDLRVLVFSIIVSTASAIAFGLLPAIQGWRLDLHSALKDGGRATLGTPRRRLRGALVVGELALALTLLTGAGLLVRSVASLLSVNPGFRAESVLSARIVLPETSYDSPTRVRSMFGSVLERSRALPGVTAASAVSSLPVSGASFNRGFRIAGRPEPERAGDMTVEYRVADPRYFTTMGIPVLRGRSLLPGDRDGAPRVAMISEEMARRHWPTDDPIGDRIALGDPADPASWRTIVGIVGSVAHFGVAGEPFPEVYVPMAQSASHSMFIVLRASTDPEPLAEGLRRIVRDIDPQQPLTDVRTMTDRLIGSVGRHRFVMMLLAVFAGVAVFLAAIGVYALVAANVQSRTREIGLRMALGARSEDIMRMVLRQGLHFIVSGIAVGVIASFAASRALESLLFGVGALDPMTYGLVAAGLAAVGVLACWVPARRAARVAPNVALAD